MTDNKQLLIDAAKAAGYELITPAKLKYYNDHHHACEAAIGVARLKLEQGDTDGAKHWLSDCCGKLQRASDELMESIRAAAQSQGN